MTQIEAGPDRVDLDYSFGKVAEADRVVPILIGIHVQSQYGMSAPVLGKGFADPRAASLVVRFLHEAGLHDRLIIRTDSEHSIISVAQQVAKSRVPAITLLETTTAGSSSSLGSGENWSSAVSGMTRVLIQMVKRIYSCEVTTSSPIIAWAVRHSSWLLNRYQPHRRLGGETSFETRQGRPYSGLVVRFSEPVFGRRPYATDQPKFQVRWLLGVWLGKCPDTDGHIVGTRQGIMVTRTIRVVGEPVNLQGLDILQ